MTNLYISVLVFCAGFCACFSAQARINSTQITQTCPTFYSSCREAYLKEKCSGKTPKNGEYDISFMDNGSQYFRRVYCDMESTNCGPEKGWMRVAHMDMTQGSKCPPGLDEGMYGSKRLCGNRGGPGCKSTTINTFGSPYTEVCGFVAGYQYKTTDAFNGKGASIDSPYVDGVSITHGTPRKHIWTYAAGLGEARTDGYACPCNEGGPDDVANFVNNDWYCESGNPSANILYEFFPNDVLWDGKNCGLKEPPCCQGKPWLPYFRKDIGGVSRDSIELRICTNEGYTNEDAPIESMEFYVH